MGEGLTLKRQLCSGVGLGPLEQGSAPQTLERTLEETAIVVPCFGSCCSATRIELERTECVHAGNQETYERPPWFLH